MWYFYETTKTTIVVFQLFVHAFRVDGLSGGIVGVPLLDVLYLSLSKHVHPLGWFILNLLTPDRIQITENGYYMYLT